MKKAIFILILQSFVIQSLWAQRKKPLQQMSFKAIIKSYYFVADFERKIPDRDISEYLFWRYPYKLGKGDFPIHYKFEDMHNEVPVTMGEGKPYHHLNAGRVAFFNGEYEKAKDIWLKGRQKYKTDYPYHRRMDYFIALAYMNMGRERAKTDGYENTEVKQLYNNAGKFFAWCLFKKEDIKDPLFNKISAKQAYNLSAIYFKYGRYAASFGAASRGLDFLRKYGKSEYHTSLSRILAESFIQNRSYHDAIKTYDVTLRYNPSKEDAAAIFNRVGDVYFDLNNYDIAIMNYEIGDKLFRDKNIIDINSLVFLGESYFWKGEFQKANTLLRYAFAYAHKPMTRNLISYNTEAYAKLRLADSYLAMGKMKLAKAQYIDITRNYRGHLAGKTAEVRSACLELPQFAGNNVEHARTKLAGIKTQDIFPQARELAWACEVGSYAQRERTDSMLDRVRSFLKLYPRSRFLKSLVDPVEDVRKTKLYTLLEERKIYDALSYFKKHRNLLFKDISKKTNEDLFKAAIDVSDLETAKMLFPIFNKTAKKSELNELRKIVYLSELHSSEKATKQQKKIVNRMAQKFEKKTWTLSRSVFTKNMIHRALDTQFAPQHLIWIYNLVQSWKVDSESISCTEQFPLMAKLYQNAALKPKLQKAISMRVHGLVNKLLPNLLRTDELCAVGLLNFEFDITKSSPQTLVSRYLKRLSWPLSEEVASIFWNAAELAQKNKMNKEARVIWQTIVAGAPNDSPKVAFARNRLEKRKTQFERLWE